jgi:phosphoglycolate phosphatase
LFDLDGTLADTAPELAATLNHVREEQGHAPLPFGQIRPVVSHGTRGLIRLGFGLSPDDPGYAPLRSRLLEVYSRDLGCQTALFPEIPELLESLEGLGLNWGIVTNKPGWLTDPLMQRLGLHGRACCIVSGDTVEYSKPHPAPCGMPAGWRAARRASACT